MGYNMLILTIKGTTKPAIIMKNHHFLFKGISLFILAIFFASCSPPKWLAGGGCGFTNFNGSDAGDWSTGSRLDLFVASEFDLSDQLSFPLTVRPTVSVAKRGADFKGTSGGSFNFTDRLRMTYVYVEGEGSTEIVEDKLDVTVAPALGYLVNATSDFDDGQGSSEKTTVTDSYQSVDFGAKAGLRYHFTKRLEVSANYYQGFTSVQENISVNNNGFAFRIGYRLSD